MTRFYTRLALPALAFAAFGAAAVMPLPALADTHGEKPAIGKKHDGFKKHGGRIGVPPDAATLDRLEKMTPEERHAERIEKREKGKTLDRAARKAEMEKRKAAFDALPEDEQKALKERHKALIEADMKHRRDAFEKLPPEEKEKVMQKMKEHKKERRAKWDALSPEEKKQKLDALPPEKREHIMKRMEKHADDAEKSPAAE